MEKIVYLLMFALLVGLTGCQNDIIEEEMYEKLPENVKAISMNALPKEITPIVLNSMEELYDYAKALNNTGDVVSDSQPVTYINRIKTRSEGDSQVGTKNITTALNSKYTIIIHLAYLQIGCGPVEVTSESHGTWFCADWTQTSGVAAWAGSSSISYSITGDVKFYVLVQTDLFEVSKQNMSVNGTTSL